MDQNIFINATSYSYSPIYQINGKLVITIEGILDGADVVTNLCEGIGQGYKTIRSCSWLSSMGDNINGSDSRYELIPGNYIFFTLKNAGASTNITLKFRIEEM